VKISIFRQGLEKSTTKLGKKFESTKK